MTKNVQFICFGEVLWDVFPNYKVIGGAPLNVALRLRSFGAKTTLISAVGKDDLGDQIKQFLKEHDMPIDSIQESKQHQTGSVIVTLDDQGSASYDISYPVAWDVIRYEEKDQELLQNADVFIFGSLVARNKMSRETLMALLEGSNFSVFDMNLREPHYSMSLLKELMLKSDFLKMNDDELVLFCENEAIQKNTMREQLTYISENYSIPQICVTRGKDGAMLLMDGEFYENSGYPCKVKDTVGAGDSFLGTLLFKLHAKQSPQEALDYACAVGSIVAGKEGANPAISENDIQKKMSGE